MGRCKLWVCCLITAVTVGCSTGNFLAVEKPPEALRSPSVESIDLDLMVRCKLKISNLQDTKTGNCRFWVGEDRVRIEISHSVIGLILLGEVRDGVARFLDGQTGAQMANSRSLFPPALLELKPQEFKALLLGRRLIGVPGFSGEGLPDHMTLSRGGGTLDWEASRWFVQQGLSVPRVISMKTGRFTLRLVVLELQLGQGEGLTFP